MIPVSLLRLAYDARSRCHSPVWLRRDRDNSFIPFLHEGTEPGARCIALKPLVSHLRYASQVINLLLLEHDPNYLCPGNYQPSKDSQGNTVTIPIENNTANFKLNLLLPPMPSDNVSYIITFLV